LKLQLGERQGAEYARMQANPLASWLVEEAWKASSSAELGAAFLSFLRAAG